MFFFLNGYDMYEMICACQAPGKRHNINPLGTLVNIPTQQSHGEALNKAKQGAQRATYRAPEYNVPPSLTDQTGRPSCFSDWPYKTQTL